MKLLPPDVRFLGYNAPNSILVGAPALIPAGGAYSTPPDALPDLRGPTSNGGEGRNSELLHWSLLKNTVVIVVTVYMSIAVRNDMHFILYRYCCEGRYSINIHLKCLGQSGKSRNLIMTGEWPA